MKPPVGARRHAPMRLRINRPICLFLAIAAVSVRRGQAQVAPLPRPEGSSAVGYWRTAIAGPHQRNILLEFWYPAATPDPSTPPRRYATPAIETALAAQLNLPSGWAAPVRTHAVENAPVLTGKHPVVLFSHGLSWPITLYRSLTEDLASRGYVVIGINHPHGAIADFGDGRVAPFVPPPDFTDDSLRTAFLARLTGEWTQDIRAVLDQLDRWNGGPPSSPLTDAIDLARRALAGHSLGASAAARLTGDSRVRAVALLEGQLRDTAATTLTVQRPLLHMIGEYNRLELENRAYRPSNTGPVYQAVIAGAGHAYFSDLIAIYKTTAPADWLARHRYELEPERIIQITRDYLAAFFGRYLLDTDSALLHPVGYGARVDGPRTAGYPEVRLTIDIP